MCRVRVIILKEDLDSVMEEIARLGIFHPAKIEEIDDWAKHLASVGVEQISSEYSKRQRRLRQLLEGFPARRVPPPGEPPREIRRLSLGEVDQALAGIEGRLQPLLSTQATLVNKKNELKTLLGQLEMLVPAGFPVGNLMQSTFLATAVGRIHESQLPTLRRLLATVPFVVFPYRKDGENLHVICVTLKRDKSVLDNGLRAVGFVEAALPQNLSQVSAEAESAAASELAAIDSELSRVAKDIEREQTVVLPDLLAVLLNVEAALLLLHVENYCKSTEKTCVFAGWVPREHAEELKVALGARTHGRAIVDVIGAEELEEGEKGDLAVPVSVKLPFFLRPFRLLVEGFGIPTYWMIDPTLFVALTFLLMFGMMFGDVGHGIVLLAAGCLLAIKSPKLSDIGKLIIYCGISSVFFGVLYGSIFGIESVIPALWGPPLERIDALFTVAIGLGIIMLSLGLVLNMINAIRMRAFWQRLFDESGPLIAMAYWAGLGIAIEFLLSPKGPFRPGPALALVALPLILFFVKGPLLRIMGKQPQAFPDGVFTYLVEGMVEIMEVLMGYLANTVSFIRVAAFGLAHAGLFVAIFGIADAVSSGPGGKPASWLVVIVGNVVVIVLEGLVVTIQALRLEYYEFFGKFFKSSGAKYDPVAFSSDLQDRTG